MPSSREAEHTTRADAAVSTVASVPDEAQVAQGVREIDQVPDRTVMEVARSGFALGDRVLRPAEVVVARHPEGTP